MHGLAQAAGQLCATAHAVTTSWRQRCSSRTPRFSVREVGDRPGADHARLSRRPQRQRDLISWRQRRRHAPGGWVSVTRRYCIKTAKPILKLFRPSIILVSSDSCADTHSKGALNTQGWEKLAISCDFRWKSPFISETVRDRPIVTMERKSWVPD